MRDLLAASADAPHRQDTHWVQRLPRRAAFVARLSTSSRGFLPAQDSYVPGGHLVASHIPGSSHLWPMGQCDLLRYKTISFTSSDSLAQLAAVNLAEHLWQSVGEHTSVSHKKRAGHGAENDLR